MAETKSVLPVYPVSLKLIGEQIDFAIGTYAKAEHGSTARKAKHLATLSKHKRTYLGILKRLLRPKGGNAYMISLAVSCFSGGVLGILRADAKRSYERDLTRIEKEAKQLDCWSICTEKVVGHWIEDTSGKVRLIAIPGVKRTAMSLIIRDILSVLGVDNKFDFARSGAGGERGYIRGITKKMTQGYNFWAMPDVTNFYLSLRPGHLKELPINDEVVCNVAFLSEETDIAIEFHVSNLSKIKDALRDKYPALVNPHPPLDEISIRSITAQALRLGLVPGSVLSPLLASWALGKAVLNAGLSDDLHKQSYVDDLAFGGKEKGAVEKGVSTIASYLSTHPAGAILIHDTTVHFRKDVVALGYRLQYGNGYKKNMVHVKPATKRIERFKRKLENTLHTAIGSGEDVLTAGKRYWRDWYQAQKAWTKVPKHSKYLSETIAITYIADFQSGIPRRSWGGNLIKTKP